MNWHPAVNINSLKEGAITELEISGKKLCILKKETAVHAFAATCPHSGARLCEGWLDAQSSVVCPLHKYRFDPANGRNTSGEGYKLKTFAVQIRGENIFINF